MDLYYCMHRCTLGLHSPAMDVAFQMQGMPKIASMVSECTLGAVPRQPQARDPRGSRRRRACAEPRGAFGAKPPSEVHSYEPAYALRHSREPVMLDNISYSSSSSSLSIPGHMLLSQDRDTTFVLDVT